MQSTPLPKLARPLAQLLFVLAFIVVVTPASAAEPQRAYSGRDHTGIEAIVKESTAAAEPWRKAANARIDKHRKANLTVRIVDAAGRPVTNAAVRVELVRHAFRFGGVIGSRNFISPKLPPAPADNLPKHKAARAKRDLAKATAAQKKAVLARKTFLAFGFNAAGFHNAFKYKHRRAFEPLLPPLLKWFADNKIPVRGHCLIWPGTNSMGTDHLDKELSALVKACRAKPDDAALKAKLRAACAVAVKTWAAQWRVYEWDVINEPRGNHDVMDILGREVMAEWFKIAAANVVVPGAKLYLNEFQVVSDMKPGVETKKIKTYRDTVRLLLAKKAPISGLGIQSRFGKTYDAETIYKRLCLLDEFNLPITATEFEMKTRLGDEATQAIMAERVMTVYFSHRLVDGIFAWTFFHNKSSETRPLVDAQGRPTLCGKVWLYLTKQRWTTDETSRTNAQGEATVRAFKGTYRITVTASGKTKTKIIHATLAADTTLRVKL